MKPARERERGKRKAGAKRGKNSMANSVSQTMAGKGLGRRPKIAR